MTTIVVTVAAQNFAHGPAFAITNHWKPHLPQIVETVPMGAHVIAAPLPTRGGMRMVVYNREPFAVEVTLCY